MDPTYDGDAREKSHLGIIRILILGFAGDTLREAEADVAVEGGVKGEGERDENMILFL